MVFCYPESDRTVGLYAKDVDNNGKLEKSHTKSIKNYFLKRTAIQDFII